MKRRLTDGLTDQIDSNLILPREHSLFINSPQFVLTSNRDDVSNLRKGVMDDLDLFQELSNKFGLPTHNAIAFFTNALKIEDQVAYSKLGHFRILLLLALSGRGFVFGTAFDLKNNCAIRPCDIAQLDEYKVGISLESGESEWTQDVEDKYLKIIYESSLGNHAELKGACYFREDCIECNSIGEKVSKQSQLVADWQRSKVAAPSRGASEEVVWAIRDILEFWDVYRKYCKNQLEYNVETRMSPLSEIVDDLPQNAVSSEEEKHTVQRELDDLYKTIKLLICLHGFYIRLEHLLEIEDKQEHLTSKQSWISSFIRFLRRDKSRKLFEAAEQTATTQKEAPESYLGLKRFVNATRAENIPRDVAKDFPVLNGEKVQHKLTAAERKAVTAYQKHPIYICFTKMSAELSKSHITKIAPYYFTHWFIHKKSPLNPFTKRDYAFRDIHVKVNDGLTVAKDERLIYYQDCNNFLYQMLCDWWQAVEARHPEMDSYNRKICDALVARCRPLVVKEDWQKVESRPIYKRWMPDVVLYQIYQKMDGLFDCGQFPIYAKQICPPDNMLYFFYEKQDPQIIKVKKCIRQLINDDIANEYKEKVFLSKDGLGNSAMPLKWHQELAEWLEGIIKRDKTVDDYVAGDPDPRYPSTAMKISEINKAITWFDDADKIYPEDVQPYLSIVEWYIQKVCHERIISDMRPKVFGLYKRVFLRTDIDSPGGNSYKSE